MALFNCGEFILASGRRSAWKIDCDALTWEDWRGLARMLAPHLPRFGEVRAVPRGGLPLSLALRALATSGPPLIVDDVWTSGESMARFIHAQGLDPLAVHRAVIFARGPAPSGVIALFRMPREPEDADA